MGANGSGKSTLIEAISWVLFGSGSVDRTDKEGIKRAGSGPHDDCTVKLIFELGGVQYQVRRTMRGRNHKVDAELQGNGVVTASSERAVTSQVEKILGMDHRSFFLSVFARQKELSALSVLTPAERKKLIVRMLDLDILQNVIDDIKKDEKEEKRALEFVNDHLLTPEGRPKREVLTEERSALEEELSSLRRQLDEANEAVRQREAGLEKAKGAKEWATAKEEEHRRHDRRLSDKNTEMNGLRNHAAALKKESSSLRERLAALPGLEARKLELDQLLLRKGEMDEGLEAHQQRKAAREQIARIDGAIASSEESIRKDEAERLSRKDPQENLDRVINNIETLNDEIVTGREKISYLERDARSIREELKELEGKKDDVQALGPESICPTCDRPMGDHHPHLLSKLAEQIAAADQRLKGLEEERGKMREHLDLGQRRKKALEERKKALQDEREKVQKLDEGLRSARKTIDTLREQRVEQQEILNSLEEDVFDEEAYADIKRRLPGLQADAQRFHELSGEKTRLPDLEKQRIETDGSIALREGEIKSIQADMAAVGYTEGDRGRAETAYATAIREVEASYREASNKALSIELTEERCSDKDKAIAEVADMEKSIADRTARVQELAVLAKVMVDFKQNVMERISPTLSEVTSSLFDSMTDSKYGGIELDDSYEMQIYDGGVKYPVSRFSGGEGDLANLCLRLAISRVLADRSGNDINFLILDEIFGSQDQVRKRNIMATLNHLEKQFHQIILISHIDDTKDLMSNVVTIKELEDGTSTVVL